MRVLDAEEVTGALLLAETARASGSTLVSTSTVVQAVDASAGNAALQLPTSTNWTPGQLFVIQRVDNSATFSVLIIASGVGASIQGSGTQITLATQWETVWVQATATAGVWRIVSRYNPNSVDSNLVHLAGAETITGNKTFTGTTSLTGPTFVPETVRTQTYTVTAAATLIQTVNATTGNTTVTLPSTAAWVPGQVLVFKRVDNSANSIIITMGGGGCTLDGSTASIALPNQGDCIWIQASATVGQYRALARYYAAGPTNDAALVHLVGAETISGTKTIGGAGSGLVLTTGAQLRLAFATAAANVALTAASEQYQAVSAAAAARTVSLPTNLGAVNPGMLFTIKKTDTSLNTVTIDAGTGGLIDGAQTYVLYCPNETVTLVSTATSQAWRVLATGPGDWVTFTPQLTAATTNPTLGTGSVTGGRFTRNGRHVTGNCMVQFGTSGVVAGSGNYGIALPVPAASAYSSLIIGTGFALYGTSYMPFHMIWATAVTLRYLSAVPIGGNNFVSAATPQAPVAGDRFTFSFDYESA